MAVSYQRNNLSWLAGFSQYNDYQYSQPMAFLA
jgi:hypothetical protein